MSTQTLGSGGLADTLAGRSNRDLRRRERLKVTLPVHLRPFDARFQNIEEVGVVVNFTCDGLYFTTAMPHYFVGMRLVVTFPYGEKIETHRKFLGLVVRIENLENGKSGVGIRFLP